MNLQRKKPTPSSRSAYGIKLILKVIGDWKMYHFMLSKGQACFLLVTVAERSFWGERGQFLCSSWFVWMETQIKPASFSLFWIGAFESHLFHRKTGRYAEKSRKVFLSISIPSVFELQMGKYSSTLRPDLKPAVW